MIKPSSPTVLRLCSALYFFNAALYFIWDRHSTFQLFGWLTLGVGFLALSFAEKDVVGNRPAPGYLVVAAGLGLLICGLFRH